jgi:hypothetical protein
VQAWTSNLESNTTGSGPQECLDRNLENRLTTDSHQRTLQLASSPYQSYDLGTPKSQDSEYGYGIRGPITTKPHAVPCSLCFKPFDWTGCFMHFGCFVSCLRTQVLKQSIAQRLCVFPTSSKLERRTILGSVQLVQRSSKSSYHSNLKLSHPMPAFLLNLCSSFPLQR